MHRLEAFFLHSILHDEPISGNSEDLSAGDDLRADIGPGMNFAAMLSAIPAILPAPATLEEGAYLPLLVGKIRHDS